MLVRLIYSIRRLLRYFTNIKKEDRSFKLLWKLCEPFSNATVKRMLTVAHGTFCLVDACYAAIRGFIADGGMFNATEFFLRLNVVGVSRFAISLYGEARCNIKRVATKEEIYFLKRNETIMLDYIEVLKSTCRSL